MRQWIVFVAGYIILFGLQYTMLSLTCWAVKLSVFAVIPAGFLWLNSIWIFISWFDDVIDWSHNQFK